MALVTHIVENPGLVRALRELPPPVLAKLIDSVGLESAGDVVALATTEQLGAVFDEDLWTADGGGLEERFDADRFSLWLRVLFEAGENAVVERLTALSPDFVTLAFQRLVLVLDIDRLGVELSSAPDELEWTEKALESRAYEEWEEFRIIARDPNAWDVVWDAIAALDRDHHHLLRGILERCAAASSEFIEENGGLYEVLTSDEMLESDARAERDDRRAARGFVSKADAGSFLELARRGAGPESSRDAVTRAYFRELERAPAPGVEPRGGRRGASAERAERELFTLLESADVIEKASPRAAGLLASGGQRRAADAGSPGRETFERAMRQLGRSNAALHTERLEELGYLANVLIAGFGTRERRPRPVDALEVAVELVAFGLERAVARDGRDPASVVREMPADRLFRSAYRALHSEPGNPEVRRIRALFDRCVGRGPGA